MGARRRKVERLRALTRTTADIDACMRRVLDGLERLKREHGVPQAESVRRAIKAYLMERSVSRRAPKAGKRRQRG